MNLTEADKNEFLLLFDYVGKKFNHWDELDSNWGLKVNEFLNFPVGTLYAKEYDQAGIEYWFYDSVLSYGMYVWYLLDAICSVITIKEGRYACDSGNFFFEKNPEPIPDKPSMCSVLFADILKLSMENFDSETYLLKEASSRLEGIAEFRAVRGHEYFFSLDYNFFPRLVIDKCEITFEIWQGGIDEIYLVITDEAKKNLER